MSTLEAVNELKQRVGEAIIGQEAVIERLIIGLLANGNILMEGLPGLAKTRAIKTLSQSLESDCRRAYRFLRDWHSLVMPDRILSESANEYGDPSLIGAIRELERAALGSNETWVGENAADLVTRWRRVLNRSRSRRSVEGLPPLNP